MDSYMSITEIANTLSVSERTLYYHVLPWIKAHCTRPMIRIGHRICYRKGAVDAYLNKAHNDASKSI